jgi:hypothetical protein
MNPALVVLLVLASGAGAATPWEAYLDLPTPQNASRVEAITCSSTPEEYCFDLRILQNQMLAMDAESFKLGYRLYRAADGGNAEDLGALLASLIRPHPAFFLEHVEHLDASCGSFRFILNVPGEEYVDHPEAQDYEIAQRRKALSAVSDPNLSTVKQRCIALIRQP